MQTKFRRLGAAAIVALAASVLIRMGQSSFEGLRGEPSLAALARPTETVAKAQSKIVSLVSRPQVALPHDELGKVGDEVLKSLPKLADFRNLSEEEVHTMPRALFQAGMKLKTFEDSLDQKMRSAQNNPEALQAAASEGALFYQNCSNQEQTPSSLRAVCYLHFIQLSVKSGHPENIPENRMPPDVLQIARAISPTNT